MEGGRILARLNKPTGPEGNLIEYVWPPVPEDVYLEGQAPSELRSLFPRGAFHE